MKRLLIGLALCVALVGGVGVYLVARLDADTLGRMVLERANRQDGLHIEAERFSLGLFSGLEMSQATIHAELESGVLDAQIERMLLEHELWPLLRRKVVVHRLILEQPALTLVSRGTGSVSSQRSPGSGAGGPDAAGTSGVPPEDPSTTGGVEIDVDLVRITDGRLAMRSDDPAAGDVEIEGLDVELRDLRVDPNATSSMLGISATGELSAAALRLGEMTLEEASGAVAIADGELRLEGVDLVALNSKLHVDAMTADLGQDPYPYELALAGNVDIDGVMGGSGSSFGPASLALAAAGLGPDLADLDGKGVLHLDAGKLPAVEMVTRIERLIGKPILTGKNYESTDVPFRIVDGALLIDPFSLAAEVLSVGGSGRVDLAGPVALALDVLAPRDGLEVKEIPKELLDALTDEEGRTTLFFQVGGTMTEPEVGLDMGRIKDKAKGAVKSKVDNRVKREVDKLKKGLFDKLKGSRD